MINKGIDAFRKKDGSGHPGVGVVAILEKNRLSYIATGIVVVPTIVIAATVPNSFSIATDIAVSVHQNMWHLLLVKMEQT